MIKKCIQCQKLSTMTLKQKYCPACLKSHIIPVDYKKLKRQPKYLYDLEQDYLKKQEFFKNFTSIIMDEED